MTPKLQNCYLKIGIKDLNVNESNNHHAPTFHVLLFAFLMLKYHSIEIKSALGNSDGYLPITGFVESGGYIDIRYSYMIGENVVYDIL